MLCFRYKMSDILDLYPGENETHFLYEHLRPIWTPGGMVCHVPECSRSESIATLRAFVRHWQAVHVATTTLFVCDHLDCLGCPTFKTKNDLVRHLMKKHHQARLEASRLASTYTTRLVSNSRYINPRGSLPPRRLSPSAEMARQADRLRRHQQIGAVPDLTGKSSNPIHAVCQDEFVTFDPATGQATGKMFRRSRRRQPAEATQSRAPEESTTSQNQ